MRWQHVSVLDQKPPSLIRHVRREMHDRKLSIQPPPPASASFTSAKPCPARRRRAVVREKLAHEAGVGSDVPRQLRLLVEQCQKSRRVGGRGLRSKDVRAL